MEQEAIKQETPEQGMNVQETINNPESPKKKKGIWIAIVCLLLIVAIGCGIGYKVWYDKTGPEAFDECMDELFREEIVLNTINLHYTLAYPEDYGITEYEVSLGDYSLDDYESGYKEMEELRDRILSFDKDRLSVEQQVTYDIVLDYLEMELGAKEFVLYSEILGPTTGYQAQLPVLLAEYTFRTQQDIEDYLELISQVDDIAEQIIEFEREKSDAGLFMSDYAADSIIEQCEGFIENPQENYMIEVFDDKIEAFDGLSDEEKQEYSEKNKEIITTEIVDAYEILIEGLEELKGTGTNDLGLYYYENGQQYYEYLVRSGTGSDLSIKKLERQTEEFLDDYIRELQMAYLENPAILDELLGYEFEELEPEEILDDLQQQIKGDFPKPPSVDYTVKYVHPSMEEKMSPAFYLTPPVDDIEGNLIYINKKYTEGDSAGTMNLYTTLAHEGYPGHLYQNVYTASCDLPLVRNLFSCTGYSEGWATYVEHEYGYLYAGMDEILASLYAGNEATSLALSAYLDMKIHYDGWNREDVYEYLTDFGVADEAAADEMFDYIVEEPANYMNYFIGYLEMMNLREMAEKNLKDDFDAKEFHDFVLSIGPAPFYIIEDYMKDWLKEQK
ncbi:MAG: DUF885 domain-containing protein [Lachnospiraceae bacterium]|nr:DUF885 domain-containing protein [Lachnospiraceae bacterium]